MAGKNVYSERIRFSMKTANDATGAPLSIKQLATATGWSYENCRKVVNGEHDGSRDFNSAVCTVLGLPEDEMWSLAHRAKVSRRLGLGLTVGIPKDRRLLDVWPRLTESDQAKVIRIAEGLALVRECLPHGNAKPAVFSTQEGR
jgi:hypothetical protein